MYNHGPEHIEVCWSTFRQHLKFKPIWTCLGLIPYVVHGCVCISPYWPLQSSPHPHSFQIHVGLSFGSGSLKAHRKGYTYIYIYIHIMNNNNPSFLSPVGPILGDAFVGPWALLGPFLCWALLGPFICWGPVGAIHVLGPFK